MQAVSARGQLLVVGLHALLGLAVLVAATILTALHDTIGSTLASLFGIILGLAGAGSAAVSTLGAAVNGKVAIPTSTISELNAIVTNLADHLAGARAQLPSSAPAYAPPPEPQPAPHVAPPV